MTVSTLLLLFFTIILATTFVSTIYKKHKEYQIKVDRIESVLNQFVKTQKEQDVQKINLQRPPSSRNSCKNVIVKERKTFHIYHIMVDRFAGWSVVSNYNERGFAGGTIQGIIERLDYIQQLGYNTIMLTPIYTSAEYHGYHTTDYTTIDGHFGDWGDFRELIMQVHNKGMKIICDFVPNHCHSSNHLFQRAISCKDSIEREWFYIYDDGTYESFQGYPDLPKFNLYNSCAAAYLINQVRILASLGVDGLRIDHAIGVPFSFLRQLTHDIKRDKPEFFFIGEVWGTGIRRWNQVEFLNEQRRKETYSGTLSQDNLQKDYVGVLDGVLDFTFRDIVLESVRTARRNGTNIDMDGLRDRIISHIDSFPRDFILVPFLDNHDTNRIMYECGNDRILVDQLLELMIEICSSYSVYYGTENYMTHDNPVGETPFSDLNARNPQRWE